MQIEIKGRNTSVTDDLRERVEKRFGKIDRQVNDLAILELELREERSAPVNERQVVEATLRVKGTTLRAEEASGDMIQSLNTVSDELSRQVKRYKDKRRRRREQRASSFREGASPA